MPAGLAVAVASEQRGNMQGWPDPSALNGYTGHYLQNSSYISHNAAESDGPDSSTGTNQLPGSATLDHPASSAGMSGMRSSLNAQPPSFAAASPAAGQSLGPAGHPPPALEEPAVPAAPVALLAVGPVKVELQPPSSLEEELSRKQAFTEMLLARAGAYGRTLLSQEEKLAYLARLTEASLDIILTSPSPENLLDEVWFAHQQQAQQGLYQSQQLQQFQKQWPAQQQLQQQQHPLQEDVYYPPPPAAQQQQDVHCEQHRKQNYCQQHHGQPQLQGPQPQQSQQPQQQQQEPQQSQQQAGPVPAKVLGPRDLDPAAADEFGASLPVGLLPDNWRELHRWGVLEMQCKFTVAGSDPETVQQVRSHFKQGKQQAVAATQAARQQDAATSSMVKQQQMPSSSCSHGAPLSQPIRSATTAGTATNVQRTAAFLDAAPAPAVGWGKEGDISSGRSSSGHSSSGSSSSGSSSGSSQGDRVCSSKHHFIPDQVLDDVHRHDISIVPGGGRQEVAPCDLPDELAAQFAAALPAGALPQDWRSEGSWKEVMRSFKIRAFPKSTTYAQARQLLHDSRLAVWQALGVTQDHSVRDEAAEQQSDKQPHQTQQQGAGSHDISPRPCDLPPEIASELLAALPDRVRMPDDWQQYTSWRVLENTLRLNTQQRRRFKSAKCAAMAAYEHWKQQQQQQHDVEDGQQTQQVASSSCEVVHRQPQQKRVLAPVELPPSAAAILESLVPAGMLPRQWREYPTWTQLDVAVCFTAGGFDVAEVRDTTKRYKEAKQAALAAAATAAADEQPRTAADIASLHPRAISQPRAPAAAVDQGIITAGWQQDEKWTGSRSNSSGSASRSSAEAATAAAPPSVSWARAAASRPAPHTVSASLADMDRTHSQQAAGVAAIDGQQAGSRSKTLRNSTTSGSSKNGSRPGSNGAAAANDLSSTPSAAEPPLDSKYIAVGQVVCFRCGDCGHVGERCRTPYCPSCTQWGHADGIDCLSACFRCGRTHKGASMGCTELECKECNLLGHKQHECPLTVCTFCKYSGHTAQDCNACSECRLWGHDAASCPGFCSNCYTAGHKAADCSVKRCPQCGKVGCVVGMCEGISGSTNSSRGSTNSSRSKSKNKAAAAAPPPAAEVIDVNSIVFDVPEDAQQKEERQQWLMGRLIDCAKVEQYTCNLLIAPEKLAVLATISAADLSLILQQPKPDQLLDQVYNSQASGASERAAGAEAASSNISQPDEATQQQKQASQQQQQLRVLMPCDLWPRHHCMFEGRLPADSLPDNWHEYRTWRQLEQAFIMNQKATARTVNLRALFRRERQRVQAAAADDMTAETEPECAIEQQKEQQKIERSPRRIRDNCQQQDQSRQQQLQHSGTGDKPPVGQQQQPQQQPKNRSGWPDLNQQQLPYSQVNTEDTWATSPAPAAQQLQQPAVKENAWSRKLPRVQQQSEEELTQKEPQQQVVAAQPEVWCEPAAESSIDRYSQQQEVQQQEAYAPNQLLGPGVAYQQQVQAVRPGDVVAAGPEQLPEHSHHQQTPQQQTQTQLLQAPVKYPSQAAQLTSHIPDPAAAAGAATVLTMAGMPFQPAATTSLSMHPAPHMHPDSHHHQFMMVQHHQPVAAQQPQQPQQQAGPVPAKVLGPRDLDPAAADEFEASLPVGLLPDNWRELHRWGVLEMQCKFTVAGSDPETVQQVTSQFKQGKQQAVAATQMVNASQLQQQQHHMMVMPQSQQQMLMQVEAHPPLPGTAAAHVYPAAPPAPAGTVPPSMIYVVGPEGLQQQQQQQQRAGSVPAMSMAAGYLPPVPTAQSAATMMQWPAHMMPAHMMPAHMMQPHLHQYMTMPVHHVSISGPAGSVAAGQQVQQTVPAGEDGDEDLNDMLGLCGVQAG